MKRSGLKLAQHAEESALDALMKIISLKGVKKIPIRKLRLVVIRIDAFNNLVDSKPCANCVNVMKKFGLRKVTYSTKTGTMATESLDTIVPTTSAGHRSVQNTIRALEIFIETHKEFYGISLMR